VRGGLLDIPERDTSARTGNERMPKAVRPDVLGQPGAAGDPPDDPPGTVPVQPTLGRGEEDRAIAAFADSQINGPGRSGREWSDGFLAALCG
jgi:hypothetical protein